MGRKLAIISTLSVVLILGAIFLIPKNHSFFAHFVNKNSIEIISQDGIELEELRLSISISATKFKNVIIFDGTSEYRIPKGYGENDWTIIYDERPMGSFRHFKTNNWHDHHYIFRFYRDEGSINCEVSIEGPDKDKAILTLEEQTINRL
jgi:hypothetical protein